MNVTEHKSLSEKFDFVTRVDFIGIYSVLFQGDRSCVNII